MDLATSYLGLALRNPLVAAASPLSNTVDGVRRLADGGVFLQPDIDHEAPAVRPALPPDTDQAACQRSGYVRALQAANSARRPW